MFKYFNYIMNTVRYVWVNDIYRLRNHFRFVFGYKYDTNVLVLAKAAIHYNKLVMSNLDELLSITNAYDTPDVYGCLIGLKEKEIG